MMTVFHIFLTLYHHHYIKTKNIYLCIVVLSPYVVAVFSSSPFPTNPANAFSYHVNAPSYFACPANSCPSPAINLNESSVTALRAMSTKSGLKPHVTSRIHLRKTSVLKNRRLDLLFVAFLSCLGMFRIQLAGTAPS